MNVQPISNSKYPADISLATVEQLIDIEQRFLLQHILPWIGFALLGSTAALLVALSLHPDVWQLWALLFTLAVASTLFFIAWKWNRTGKSSASRYLVLLILLVVNIPLPLLLSGMIVPHVIIILLVALMAGILLSLRAGLSMAVAMTITGLAIYFILQDPTRLPLYDVPSQYVDSIDMAIYLFTLFLGTYMISLNYDGKTRALHQVIQQARELSTVNDQLSHEIQRRQQIEQKQENLIAELETQNAELERFTYTVSHDLKSPLITMQGFLGYLEQDAINGNQDRLQNDVQQIRQAAKTMYELLEDLLELSRLGRVVNPSENCPMSDLVALALARVDGLIKQSNILVSVAPDLPQAFGDKSRLIEVWQNMIENAVKHRGDQPTPQITIGYQEKEDEVVYFVKDNGRGIQAQYHETVFGLFNRLENSSDGTGIGLALVKRIVELHEGEAWLESEGLGHGSTFFFSLPKQKRE